MHKHQNDKNEMTFFKYYLFILLPMWETDSLLFSCTCMNDDEQKHNNVKFQIEFPIFFFPFLSFFVILHPPYYTPYICLRICSFLQRGRRLG